MTTVNRRVLARGEEIQRIIARLAHQMLEPNEAQAGLVLLGVRRGGEALAVRLGQEIERISGRAPALGFLNINFISRRSRQPRVTRVADSRRRRRPHRRSRGRRALYRPYGTLGARRRYRPRPPFGDPALRSGRPRAARAADSARFRRTLYSNELERTRHRLACSAACRIRRGDHPRGRACGYAVA